MLEKLNHESQEEFELFQRYIQSGPNKSLSQLAVLTKFDKRDLTKICIKNNWKKREESTLKFQSIQEIHNQNCIEIFKILSEQLNDFNKGVKAIDSSKMNTEEKEKFQKKIIIFYKAYFLLVNQLNKTIEIIEKKPTSLKSIKN